MTRFYLETLTIDTEYDLLMDFQNHSAVHLRKTQKLLWSPSFCLILLLNIHFPQF